MQRELRLKKRTDFKKVYTYGRSIANRSLVLYMKVNTEIEDYRFGISVSKKVGKAVTRNMIKRTIKEAIRSLLSEYEVKKNLDIVIIVRKPAVEMDFHQLRDSLEHLFYKMKLINKLGEKK